jgi:hypothetical protein
MTHVPPSGSKGGLLLAWRHGVNLECFSTDVNKINAWCYSDPPHTPWILSCLYGPPYRKYDSCFWDSLTADGNNFVAPWLCIGDFNKILDQSEKLGGRPFACSSHDPFREFYYPPWFS